MEFATITICDFVQLLLEVQENHMINTWKDSHFGSYSSLNKGAMWSMNPSKHLSYRLVYVINIWKDSWMTWLL